MSAPVTHDPLVVNTQDGCCWTRRAVNRAGRGLYALADATGPVPVVVLATLAELAEHGLASMAFALPVPVGSGPELSEVERLRAQVAELLAERHSTNEALDDAVRALRALERRPGVDGITRVIAPTQALQPVEDPCRPCGCPKRFERHAWGCPTLRDEDPFGLHHSYRVGRDLPELGGQR